MNIIGNWGWGRVKYTHQEWLAELASRFGDNNLNWSFECPACGKVSTLQEFKNAGASPDDAYQTCIGRHTGKGPPTKGSKDGCNWCAYGLFGTLGKGDVVVTEGGSEVSVFSMAELPEVK